MNKVYISLLVTLCVVSGLDAIRGGDSSGAKGNRRGDERSSSDRSMRKELSPIIALLNKFNPAKGVIAYKLSSRCIEKQCNKIAQALPDAVTNNIVTNNIPVAHVTSLAVSSGLVGAMWAAVANVQNASAQKSKKLMRESAFSAGLKDAGASLVVSAVTELVNKVATRCGRQNPLDGYCRLVNTSVFGAAHAAVRLALIK